jgi:hypothetical protein
VLTVSAASAARCDKISILPTPIRRDPAGFAVYSGTAAFLDVDLEYPWGKERRPSSVFASEASLAALRGIPLSIEHPPEKIVTSRTAKRDVHGSILSAALRTDSDDNHAIGIEVIVYSDEALEAIERGDYGLSLGYTPVGNPADPTGVVWNHVSLTRPGDARSRLPTGAAARLDSESTDMMTIPQLLELLSDGAREEAEKVLAEMDAGSDVTSGEEANTVEVTAPGDPNAMENSMEDIKHLAATVAELAKKVDALTRTDSVSEAAGRATLSVQRALRLGAAMESAGCRTDSVDLAAQMKSAAEHIEKAAPDLATAAGLAVRSGDAGVIVDLLAAVKARTDSQVADANGQAIVQALFAANGEPAGSIKDLSKIRI